MSIEVRSITKTFGSYTALEGVDIEIPSGELVALLGPSGSGKTTLLRIIAGLEVADSGTILLDGVDAAKLDVRDRLVGFVFQHYALFRHMSVFENVAFGLRVRPRSSGRQSDADIRAKVHDLLKMMHLEGLAQRYPSQLSGGQRQRVALARALAVDPKVLLLDEPFGALDARVRHELRRWLRRLHDELRITSVFVTHDQEEALEVADRIAVLNEGRVEQVGTPEEVYDHPANPFVYSFLGTVNIFRARIRDGQVHIGGTRLWAPGHAGTPDVGAVGYARPHDIEIARQRNSVAAIEATVRHIQAVGPIVRLELVSPHCDDPIEAQIGKERYRELELAIGEQVFVSARNLQVFAPDYQI